MMHCSEQVFTVAVVCKMYPYEQKNIKSLGNGRSVDTIIKVCEWEKSEPHDTRVSSPEYELLTFFSDWLIVKRVTRLTPLGIGEAS